MVDDSLKENLYMLYNTGGAREAVMAADSARSADDPLDNLASLCAMTYVDRGSELGDAVAVSKGVSIFAEIIGIKGISPEDRNRFRYNLANGYGALARCHEVAGDAESRLIAWKQERDELQAILLDRSNVPEDILPEILTNFGNCLSYLGRKAEALDSYLDAIRLRPGHPVASGCAGQILLELINVQPIHNTRLLSRAIELLDESLSDLGALRAIGGPIADVDFRKSLEQASAIADRIFEGGRLELENLTRSSRAAHIGIEAQGATATWASENLLLTLNPYAEWCASNATDDLFFDGLMTAAGPEGEERFTLLAHTLNQIKEEYATSRYALLQAGKVSELAELSKATHFADTLDYADFGLSSGLLKMSMRLSIDLLDKVAVFLNRYLELGLKERSVSFATVWYENDNAQKGIEGIELGKHLAANNFLRGVRDVAETLNVYPAPAKDIRNKATHDFVIIENMLMPQVRLNGSVVTGDAHEFAKHLLRISRGVIISLVAFVQRTEGIKKLGSQGLHLPMEFRFAQGLSDELRQEG